MTLEESTKKSIEKTKDLVEQCLSEDERCRNDDLWLILNIWKSKQQIRLFIPYDKLNTMISPETIRRVRQKIQSEGRFLPTDEKVINRRKKREQIFRKEMVKKTPQENTGGDCDDYFYA